MERLESLNPNRSKKALRILKFIIVLFLLPWVFAFTAAFINELKTIQQQYINRFLWGIITFLVFYLFIYEFAAIYKKGQKITEATFRFISPLVKVTPFVIPIYSIAIFFIYYLVSLSVKPDWLIGLFLFLIGFSTMLHLVFSARLLHSRRDDFLMINYLFSFGFIYIINIALLALIFSILFTPFSWLSFSKLSFQISRDIFSTIFTQLFL